MSTSRPANTDREQDRPPTAAVDLAGHVWRHPNPVELFRFLISRNDLLRTIGASRRPWGVPGVHPGPPVAGGQETTPVSDDRTEIKRSWQSAPEQRNPAGMDHRAVTSPIPKTTSTAIALPSSPGTCQHRQRTTS
jgi:hypothetical protein